MQVDKIGVRHGDKLPSAKPSAQDEDVHKRRFQPTAAMRQAREVRWSVPLALRAMLMFLANRFQTVAQMPETFDALWLLHVCAFNSSRSLRQGCVKIT
jgi:hypothetical protein